MSCGFLLFWWEPWLCSLSEKYCFLLRFYKWIKKTNSRHSGLKNTPSQCWSPHSSVDSSRSQGSNTWISSKFEARHIKICRIFGCFMLNQIWNPVLISELHFDTPMSYFLNCVPRYRCLVFITVDVMVISVGSPQRVSVSSWTYHLC